MDFRTIQPSRDSQTGAVEPRQRAAAGLKAKPAAFVLAYRMVCWQRLYARARLALFLRTLDLAAVCFLGAFFAGCLENMLSGR